MHATVPHTDQPPPSQLRATHRSPQQCRPRSRLFTYDPKNYAPTSLSAFVDELHTSDMHWVPIVDCAVASEPGFPPYDRAMGNVNGSDSGGADSVFVQGRTGGPYFGQALLGEGMDGLCFGKVWTGSALRGCGWALLWAGVDGPCCGQSLRIGCSGGDAILVEGSSNRATPCAGVGRISTLSNKREGPHSRLIRPECTVPFQKSSLKQEVSHPDSVQPWPTLRPHSQPHGHPSHICCFAQVWSGPSHWVDWLHPRAAEYWGGELLTWRSNGGAFDGVWIDMNEPSNFCTGDNCAKSDTSLNATCQLVCEAPE
eukprot:15553-Chlamydomonas_euryale.AAC.1